MLLLQTEGLEAVPAPSTATMKTLFAPPPGSFLEDEPEGTERRASRSVKELSRQEQLLNDRRLSLKAKLDLKARLEAANLGSLLFVHGPQVAASQEGTPGARLATARSGAATARTSSPPRPRPAATRPLTARLATPRAALDIATRRPATAQPAAPRSMDEASAHRQAPTPRLRIWAVQSAPAEHAEREEGPEQDIPASRRGPARTIREGQAPGDWVEEAPEQILLKCHQSFQCQPDPRWKDRFRETALELQKAMDLERAYADRMGSYGGKQISRARIQLNTPRDEPDRARVLGKKQASQ